MKKIYLLLLLFAFNACGNNKPTLHIFMWSDTIPVEVYKDFEKETGIRIVEDAISSNEEIYAKIKSSRKGYDIVTPSLDYSSIMINEGLIAKLDTTQMPNLANIDPTIMKSIESIDPTHQYIMPFLFGPTVIAYNTKTVSEDVQNFDIFSNLKYKGRMMLLNDMREVLGSALLSLGYSMYETNEKALTEATALLNTWKNNVLRFDADAYHIAFANGEIDVVHGYSDSIALALTEEQLEHTKFVIPNKGAVMWLDSFLVLESSQNKENAMKFIDFIHRPEIYAQIMDYIYGLSLNVPARELVEEEAIIDYDELSKATMLLDIGQETLQIHSRIWENMQAQ